MKRAKLPLWRWDPFLLGVLLGVSLLGTLVERLASPIVLVIGLTVLLGIGSVAAVLIVLPVVDGTRHRGSIEAAVAHGTAPFVGVLVPRATAWLGRDYRVAVDLLVGGKLYRSGYLPREIDQRVDAALTPLARTGSYVAVPVSILNPKRPFALRVALDRALTEARQAITPAEPLPPTPAAPAATPPAAPPGAGD